MSGQVGILNVGAGDTKLIFDKDNPMETARASRIVKDMIRRGYVLFIEHPPGSKTMTRVRDFNENTAEYIIADLDPLAAQAADAEETRTEETSEPTAAPANGTPEPQRTPRRGRPPKTIHASTTRAVAVPRSAGG